VGFARSQFFAGCFILLKIAGLSGIAQQVFELAKPYAESLGLSLWDVRYVKEGADFILRITIEKQGGVFVDDCAELSRCLDGPLDDADIVKQAYCLEVTSPGLGRELCRPWHFESKMGENVVIRLVRPQDGMREFKGELLALSETSVLVSAGEFALEGIQSVKLDDDYVDFN
jgi:ribosome maturation factor RimP